MAESIRRKIIPALISGAVGVLMALFGVIRQAGALEQRVIELERNRSTVEGKLDKVLELQYETLGRVIKLEAHLKK